MIKTRTLLFPILVLVLAALACGGADPVTMDELGVFPGASPVEEGNLVAESLAESIREGAGSEAVDVDVRTYRLPGGTAWEEVSLFYTSQTAGGDWTAAADLTQSSEFVSTLGWTRGGLMAPQAFVVAFTPDPLGGPPYLVQMLFSE